MTSHPSVLIHKYGFCCTPHLSCLMSHTVVLCCAVLCCAVLCCVLFPPPLFCHVLQSAYAPERYELDPSIEVLTTKAGGGSKK